MSLDEHALYLSQKSKISAKKYNRRSNHNKEPLIQNKGPSLQNKIKIKPISILCTINDSECALPNKCG